jgi:hypothetical protein
LQQRLAVFGICQHVLHVSNGENDTSWCIAVAV